MLLAGIPAIWAQGSLGPNKNLEAIGVPPIPACLAKEIQPYNNIYGLPLAGWNPLKHEIWLKGSFNRHVDLSRSCSRSNS